MATTFITLVNDVAKRLNEVQVTTAEFLTVVGFHSQIKDSVNVSLQEIGQEQFEFPFNHNTANIITSTGTAVYSLESDMKTADLDTFRIRKSTAENIDARRLKEINFDTFIQRFYERDENANVGDFDTPNYVYRTLDNRVGFSPVPDKAYTIAYDYFKFQSDLVAHSDTMFVPDSFKNVVVDGAMFQAYMFRDNSQQAAIARQRFEKGVENMRKLLVNRFTDVRDTRVSRLINYPHGDK